MKGTSLLYSYSIDVATDPASPVWTPVDMGDASQNWSGSAAGYGRQTLRLWIEENEEEATDGNGNPRFRITVWFADVPQKPYGGNRDAAAIVDCTQLSEPSERGADLEITREGSIYAQLQQEWINGTP